MGAVSGLQLCGRQPELRSVSFTTNASSVLAGIIVVAMTSVDCDPRGWVVQLPHL